MIKIEKVEGGYKVAASPPHVRVDYRSSAALGSAELIEELLKRGAHQTDIGDALYAADPNWLRG